METSAARLNGISIFARWIMDGLGGAKLYANEVSMTDFEEPSGLEHHFVQVNGHRLHVASIGDGPPLLLLHGWPEFWATWLPLMHRLKSNFRLIAPDFYGFGRSDKPEVLRDDLDGDFHADDLAKLIPLCTSEPPIIVSHDVGAFVSQRLALNNPSLVRGLFFFDCPNSAVGSRWIQNSQINEIWYQSFNQTCLAERLVGHSEDTIRLYFEHFLQHWSYKKDAFAPALNAWVKNFSSEGALVGGFSWYRSYNSRRLRALTGELEEGHQLIKQKTCVLWGRHDPICKSSWSEVLDRVFAEFTVGFAEEAGHFPHVEVPDLAASEILQFANSLG